MCIGRDFRFFFLSLSRFLLCWALPTRAAATGNTGAVPIFIDCGPFFSGITIFFVCPARRSDQKGNVKSFGGHWKFHLKCVSLSDWRLLGQKTAKPRFDDGNQFGCRHKMRVKKRVKKNSFFSIRVFVTQLFGVQRSDLARIFKSSFWRWDPLH